MSLLFYVQIADYVIDPMCRGIFAGSAHSLSMRSAFPVIHQYETSHGSIIRGALLTKSGKTTIIIVNATIWELPYYQGSLSGGACGLMIYDMVDRLCVLDT